jgi:hypothetical protein
MLGLLGRFLSGHRRLDLPIVPVMSHVPVVDLLLLGLLLFKHALKRIEFKLLNILNLTLPSFYVMLLVREEGPRPPGIFVRVIKK